MSTEKIDALIDRYRALEEEMQGVSRAIEAAKAEVFRHTYRKNYIVQRFMSGDAIVLSFDRYWWVSADGDLLEMVDDNHVPELKALVQAGAVERSKLL